MSSLTFDLLFDEQADDSIVVKLSTEAFVANGITDGYRISTRKASYRVTHILFHDTRTVP